MCDIVPSARYSSVCNVLHQWRIWLTPTYRVYRMIELLFQDIRLAVNVLKLRLLLHLRPNYIHSASNDIHTDGPRATARARG